MDFLEAWLTGYVRPLAVAGKLAGRPAPYWGLSAHSLRAALDALVLYLPLALMEGAAVQPSMDVVPIRRLALRHGNLARAAGADCPSGL